MHKIPNFSSASERVITLAAQESLYQKHHFIGTEHVFNALCKTDDEMLRQAFDQAKLDPLIRRQIRGALLPGVGSIEVAQMILTPRVNRMLKTSQNLALAVGSKIEPIHLLGGLLKAGEGLALRLLRRFHQDPEALQVAVEKALGYPNLQSRSKTPFLNSLGRDLTYLAATNQLDPLIGRDTELQQMAQTLLRKKKNNVLLVGDAGVGKTSLVEGLAQMLTQEGAPPSLKNKRIIEISTGSLVSGTKYRGDLELRVQKLLAEAKDQDVILFVDEFHTIMSTSGFEGAPDVANMMKPDLASGHLRVIGATTWKEYRTCIEPDAAFERRFQVVDVKELSPADTLQVLQRLREIYERHHRVKIAPEALEMAVDLAVRFIPERRLPDKAIDMIDQACATYRLQHLAGEAESPVDNPAAGQVDRQDIAMVAASWSGVPLDKLLPPEDDRYLHLEEVLQERILGQSEAISAVASALRLAQVGLVHPERPRGVFLFVGPTGVGKTELARALADAILSGRKALVRLDMSEFMEAHSVAKLIGAPPGYVGYGDEGQLTGPVRRNAHVVILFDEIEKAHPEILNLLLQVLDAGHLTDSKGRRVNFKESIIIFTSNVAPTGERIGFGGADSQRQDTAAIEAELRRRFLPEFLNRLDKRIVFNSLTQEVCRQIIKGVVDDVAARLMSRGAVLEVDDAVYEVLLETARYRTYGAREIKRTVNLLLAEPLSRWLLENQPGPAHINIHLNLGQIGFSSQSAPGPES